MTFIPTASKAWCTPPPVSSITAATGSVSDALTTCVAPSSWASSSFEPHHVDSDDLVRTGDPRALDRRESDPTAPDDGDRLAGCHLRGTEHGSETGGDPAADQGRLVERHVAGDLHERVLVDEHLLGKRRQMEELLDDFPVGSVQTGRLARSPHQLGVLVLAQRQVPVGALRAVTAECRQAGDDVITRLDVADHRPDGFDDAGRLVPEHGRALIGVLALHEVQVAVAETSRDGANENLSRSRLTDLDVFDLEMARDVVENSGAHLPNVCAPVLLTATVPLSVGRMVPACAPDRAVRLPSP